jgi:hypothetical protein
MAFFIDKSSEIFSFYVRAIEVNHELIRRVLPKGKSFNDITQEDIVLMMNYINSYKRKKLNNRTPYETFSFYYGEEILHKLGCSKVAANNPTHPKKQGWILRLQKNLEGVDLHLAFPFPNIIRQKTKIKLHFDLQSGISPYY